MKEIKSYIRNINDFPKEGITFRDITPLLQNAKAFELAVEQMAEMVKGQDIDYFVGIESRGFIFASALSMILSTGLVVIRKPGKLPYLTINASYDLEYGQDSLEIHKDAVSDGKKVIIVDDLLATGGTAEAAGNLIKQLNGNLLGYLFLIELTALNGSDKLDPDNIWSVIKYND